MFTNASEDILGIFTDALDRLGVHWTQTTPRVISVARRDDVAYLDTFVRAETLTSYNPAVAGVEKLAYSRDSKSRVRKDLRVRVPPPAPPSDH